MATAINKSHDSRGEALEGATVILWKKIQSLPADDRRDLFEVLPLLNSDDSEEAEEARDTCLEILMQTPSRVHKIDVKESTSTGLRKWKEFVSARIRQYRKEAGLTQEQLGERAGIPQSHVSKLETGGHSPSNKTLQRIADALNIPLSSLDPSS